MALYEYQCQACKERLEVLQKWSDAPLTICPHCGGELKKLPSSPAVQFKGSGWYVTDYAGKGKAAKPDDATKPGEKAAKPAEAGSDSAKSESTKAEKPAAATTKSD
jgi:putative FmdB family regulatory protein